MSAYMPALLKCLKSRIRKHSSKCLFLAHRWFFKIFADTRKAALTFDHQSSRMSEDIMSEYVYDFFNL